MLNARPASNLSKILRRELKHDLDAGGCEMTPELTDLLKIVEKKMTIEVFQYLFFAIDLPVSKEFKFRKLLATPM